MQDGPSRYAVVESSPSTVSLCGCLVVVGTDNTEVLIGSLSMLFPFIKILNKSIDNQRGPAKFLSPTFSTIGGEFSIVYRQIDI